MKNSFLFESPEALVSRRSAADRLLFFGNERDHKLPQLTHTLETLLTFLKKKGR